MEAQSSSILSYVDEARFAEASFPQCLLSHPSGTDHLCVLGEEGNLDASRTSCSFCEEMLEHVMVNHSCLRFRTAWPCAAQDTSRAVCDVFWKEDLQCLGLLLSVLAVYKLLIESM